MDKPDIERIEALTDAEVDEFLRVSRTFSDEHYINSLIAEIRRANHALRDAAMAGRWIPVSERLPESGTVVLIRGWGEKKKHYIFALGAWFKTRTGSKWVEGNVPSDSDSELWFEPVDWMPLPPPPSEERP